MKDSRVFVDTNILLYALDQSEGRKHARAKELVSGLWEKEIKPSVSVQVLQEFYVNMVRKSVSPELAKETVLDYAVWNVVDNTLPLFRDALRLQRQYQVSFWDSMILAAAVFSGSRILYSEDFNAGQKYEGVKVVNPLLE